MSSEVPKKIYEKIEKAYTQRQTILETGKGLDYKFIPEETMKDAAAANKEAQAIINEPLNKKNPNIEEITNTYRTANSICGMTRDHLALATDRLHCAAAYASEVRNDIEQQRLKQAIPGVLSKD